MESTFSNVHPHVEKALHSLFKRACLDCPGTTPSCPSCSGGKVCSLVPQSCDTCAYTTCVASNDGSPHHSGPNVAAIAGGVIGGIFFVGVLVFAFYWYVIRPRRIKLEEEWEEEDQAENRKSNFNMQRSERASVHTVHSVANSILSRASNFIPIAYIPGVMNRNGGEEHVPPVPPIPAAHGPPLSASSSNGDALFFRPGDLRDSTYSDTSSLDNRSTFFGRPSITPSLARSSIATYRDDAVVNPMPAQTVLRGKANVVSVKSGNSGTPTSTPPQNTPADEISNPLNRSASGRKLNIVMPASSDAIRPGSSNSDSSQQTLSSASYGKPVLLTLGSKTKPKGRFPVSPDPQARPNVSSPLASSTTTTPDTEIDASPFADSASISSPQQQQQQTTPKRTPGGLSAVIEETASARGSLPANKRLSRQQYQQVPRGQSPFGDEHEA
ncbi:hypothetical protein E4T42_00693 [Aureobasidium subglaciale]|nr:hypothetical protein E4T38_01763 [Aureobasidium subglaciale]KAI5229417.1 hypothetical protein E4T40_01717 [Aureobasidium subglaciale]KAI5232947.1 hypothetical protein E4T41_01761 [Aureobasidium subglaciale]KAI5257942.1 hypothetical protein E4T42_00693 [Aureobasidium subglaciale]KAI5266418.1 hypothetical protein E4T46_01714 [Aureobasidium subglaciale]